MPRRGQLDVIATAFRPFASARRAFARAPRAALALLGLLALLWRATLEAAPVAEGAAAVGLSMLVALALIAVLSLGCDRAGLAAALTAALAVILLPAGELVGLVVGTGVVAAVVLAVSAHARSGAPIPLLGSSLVALSLHAVTSPQRLLDLGLEGWPGLVGLPLLALLGPALVLGAAVTALARQQPGPDSRIHSWWLLVLVFALGGSLDLSTLVVLPLLALTPLALRPQMPGAATSDAPAQGLGEGPGEAARRWQPAVGWMGLAAGAVFAPALTLLALAAGVAGLRRTLALVLAAAAAVVAVERGGLDLNSAAFGMLLGAAAVARRPTRRLPADLLLLGAGATLGPGGWLIALARIVPRPEPWLASLAGLALVIQSFPWLGARLSAAAVAAWAPDPVLAVLALGLIAAAVAALGVARPRLAPATSFALVLLPLVCASWGVVARPVVSVPTDLGVDSPQLEVQLGPGSTARELVVDSQLAFAAGLQAGTVVAEVEVRDPAGQLLLRVPLRNGVETAEWASRAAGVVAPAGPSWIHWIAPSGGYLGTRNRAKIVLPDESAVASITIRREVSLPPAILLTIHGVAIR